jgi:hypothetical protein
MGEAAPFVEIMLDKPRKMQFTFGVAKKFKEHTGKSITDIDENMTFDEVTVLLYLTLRVEDKELTQEQADDLFHVANLEEYTEKLLTLIGASTPEAGGGPKAPASPTGSSSGASDESASA